MELWQTAKQNFVDWGISRKKGGGAEWEQFKKGSVSLSGRSKP